jgi:DMSO/TMAO reductase YedYZ molybdopterin-dependent catalytic subunit
MRRTRHAHHMRERVQVTQEPYNAETPHEALLRDETPVGRFFVRSHFPAPALDARAWRLRIGGAVARPREVTYDALLAMPARELTVALECAGNGRTRMAPKPPGTPWGDLAVACARFRGVPFRDLVGACGIEPGTVEFVFAGADEGEAHGDRVRYERSLTVAHALHEDVLVVTHMGGAPLAPEHGAPVRLLVPGWYGVASVKWLVEARAVKEPFRGFYQAEHYVYHEPRGMDEGPVTTMRVKALVAEPADGARVRAGEPVTLRGRAWSGDAPIARVEVSDDAGRTWHEADVAPAPSPYAWHAWTLRWTPPRPGEWRLLVRATDEAGNAQPLEAPWNALGYGWNRVEALTLYVS